MAVSESADKNPRKSEKDGVNYKQEYFKLRQLARDACIGISFGEYSTDLGHRVEDLKEFDNLNNYINDTMWLEFNEDD